jgi:hypothetical protein
MKIASYIVLLICLPIAGFAQMRDKTWELGLFGGLSNYQGDLAPDIIMSESHPAIGLAIVRNISPYFSYGLHATYGQISGNDNNFKSLQTRDLSFYSNIFEISPQIEFNFFPFAIGINNNKKNVTPYVYSGLSLFHFDPRTTYKGESYRLQPLHTEGQGVVKGAPDPYSLWSFSIPIGAGFKFRLNDSWNLLVHGDFNTAFTDYLDDVSGVYADKSLLSEKAAELSDPSGKAYASLQRGNSELKDWYIFGGVTLSYVLTHGQCYKFGKWHLL